jgi:pectinesterase
MKKLMLLFLTLFCCQGVMRAVTDNADTLVVAQDGSAKFSTLWDAIEDCRAFMDYHKVILVKKGVYREKVIVPSWMTNLEILGEDRDETVIVFDDYANKLIDGKNIMGTFRTYTVKVEGNDITFKNITLSNDSGRKGQAVALHTEGDRLKFINCRILGNQDTVYTGVAGTRLYFEDCYIEGTTDFIFGPSTAWFEHCTIHSLINSYVTAASTPANCTYGYIFNRCTLTAAEGVDKVYLGRPWRPYAYTLYMNCTLGAHILPVGWHNWGKLTNESTARYAEYNNNGAGAANGARAPWTHQLTKKEAKLITPEKVFELNGGWKVK